MDTLHRIVVMLLVLLAPAVATAAKLKVPDDHATIQAAVDVAVAGDVIVVAKGTHAPFVVDGKAGLTIKGKGKPVVDGGGGVDPVVTIRNADGIVLDGLVLANAADRIVYVTASQNVAVRRCAIQDSLVDGLRADSSTNVIVEKNRFERIDNDAADFTGDGLAPAVDSRIQKNTFTLVGDEAIELQGTGHVIAKNTIFEIEESGIVVEEPAAGITISKNKIVDSGDSAIDVAGDGHVVEKNTLVDNGDEGIHVRNAGSRIEKNKIVSPDDDGIDVEGSNNQFLRNTITDAGGAGIEIGETETPGAATGNLFEGNKATGAREHGFHVRDAGNTFRANKAKKTIGFGLFDEAGGNVYEKNKFDSEAFD